LAFISSLPETLGLAAVLPDKVLSASADDDSGEELSKHIKCEKKELCT
jgi:hypothetical protein